MSEFLNVRDPWSPLILQDNYPDFDWPKLKPKCFSLVSRAKANSFLEKDGGASSVSLQSQDSDQPHTWKEFAKFQEWMNPRINEAIEKFHLTEQPYQVSNSWINRHPTGAWTDEHVHRDIQITIAVYLQVPENSGRIMFRDPLEANWAGQPSEWRGQDGASWYPVDIKTGDVLFFPGWLPHKTEVNKSKQDRYVMTINLMGQVPMKFLV
jgi:uncharacterized protein (TIGR02466 family)